MSRLAKLICTIGIFATVGVILYLIGSVILGSASNPPTQVSAANRSAGGNGDAASSSQSLLLYPAQLTKNGFKWKGQSATLDTLRMPVLSDNGNVMGSAPFPGGTLRFEKMLDEHTAMFQVLTLGDGDGVDVESEGEIAVITPDSDPPDSSKPWQVVVSEPLSGQNAMGGPVTVSAVRFMGYTKLPASASDTNLTSKPLAAQPNEASPDQTDKASATDSTDKTSSSDSSKQLNPTPSDLSAAPTAVPAPASTMTPN